MYLGKLLGVEWDIICTDPSI